ncbi:MAG: potassium transporter [Hyphomicrobiales bacterium]|nr:potassium transporter [Hyphomicrobiales bacterium]MDE2018424.1 potassium transporter [Hyphomicrobiales bacterium]
MTASWPAFFGALAAWFVAMNALFATLYSLGPDAIADARGPLDRFFFSVETLATVGYGDMHPQTLYGHAVATVEIFLGMISLALLTGLLFARFSRPRARLLFARRAAIGPFDGAPTLMLRVANARHSAISGATARLWIIATTRTAEGIRMRRFRELPLERSENPAFALTWTLMHRIDASSPIAGLDGGGLAAVDAQFVVTITGFEENSAQEVHARHSFAHADIDFGARYVDILSVLSDGVTRLDYAGFHATAPVDERGP